MKKRFGFTLAEVLITLGIIGVVAAMTIPTLIANTNSARFRSQFKKSVSTLAQAGLMAQAQYDFSYGDITDACGGKDDDPETDMTFCSLFNGALSGHVIYTGGEDVPKNKKGEAYSKTYGVSSPYYLQLADGSMVIFNPAASGCIKKPTEDLTAVPSECIGVIDVNGTTLPNKIVSCENAAGGMLAQPAYAADETLPAIELGTCVVPNDAQHMTDVFPIVFHDGTVEAATKAARYVLTTSK